MYTQIGEMRMWVGKYANRELAVSAAYRMRPIGTVVMGDDGRWWVVSYRDGVRLVKAGYEELPLRN